MNSKWIGAFFIIAGCAGVGFSMAAASRREMKLLRSLSSAIGYMRHSLEYRLTPLPELCRQAGKASSGAVREVLLNLARELDWQCAPDVSDCMGEALKKSQPLPVSLRRLLRRLGNSLGQFDLPGQLEQLQRIQQACDEAGRSLGNNQEVRLRNYRTLGLCAGTALAILFL